MAIVDAFSGIGRLRPAYQPMGGISARGVVVLGEPPIDKIATIALVQRKSKYPCEKIDFWRTKKHPDSEEVDRWRSRQLVPIDIGVEKYNELGVGSAFEQTARVYNLVLCTAEEHLQKILAENNRTGYLKSGSWKIPWILREAYKLGEKEEEVVQRVVHVVNAWIDAHNIKWNDAARGRTRIITGGLPRILEDPVTSYFSVHQYAFCMALLETDTEEAEERLRWFYRIAKRSQGLKKTAQSLWEQKQVPGLKVIRRRDGITMGFLETDNPYLSRENRLPVLVCLNSLGHIAVLTNHRSRVSLDAVAEALQKALGDAARFLFYDKRIEAILFGTRQYSDTPAFPLAKKVLKQIVINNVIVEKRTKRARQSGGSKRR